MQNKQFRFTNKTISNGTINYNETYLQTLLNTAQNDADAAAEGTILLWMAISGVFVFFMQAGYSVLESGSVRFKNYKNVLIKNTLNACVGGIVWWLWGYGLAFGSEKKGGFVGNKYFFGYGLGEDKKYMDWFFQYQFACITSTIVSGALAERANIYNYLIFAFLMIGFIYPVLANWTFGGGFLASKGYYDFAGGGVVHVCGGVAAFAATIVMGPRLGFYEPIRPDLVQSSPPKDKTGYQKIVDKYLEGRWPLSRVHIFIKDYDTKLNESEFYSHSPTNVAFGTLILWLGWLFFCAGCTVNNPTIAGAGMDAQLAMMNVCIAGSVSGIVVFIFKRPCGGRQDIRLDFASLTNGIIAGLVGITAGANVFEPWACTIISIFTAFVYIASCLFLKSFGVDDPLQVTQVHGFCGVWGVIAVAIFKKGDGLAYGGAGAGALLRSQALGVLAIFVWTFVTCGVFFLISKKLHLFRLTEADEILGGDIHYFAPTEFTGRIHHYDAEEGVARVIAVEGRKKLLMDQVNKKLWAIFSKDK